MSIYEERPEKPIPNKQVIQEDDFEINPYIDLTDVLNSYVDFDDSVIYFNEDIGLAYPILKNIPLLHKDNMIIASKLSEMIPK